MIGTRSVDPASNLYPAHPLAPKSFPLLPLPTPIDFDGEPRSSSETSDSSSRNIDSLSSPSSLSLEVNESPVNGHPSKSASVPVPKASGATGQHPSFWKKGVKKEENADGSKVSENRVRLIKAPRQRPSRVSETGNVAVEEKVSKFSKVLSQEKSNQSDKISSQENTYKLSCVPLDEMNTINDLLSRHPEFTKKYKFTVQKVIDPEAEERFELEKKNLRKLAESKFFSGSTEGLQEQDVRKSIDESIKKMRERTEYDNVYTLTAFHATKIEHRDTVLETGLQIRATTDPGFFGQGIYLTDFPDYAALYGHCIFMVKVVAREYFPVTFSDFDHKKLMGKPLHTQFDGHAIHVVPERKDVINGTVFVPRRSIKEPAMYDEIVVKRTSQTLITHVLQITPSDWYLLWLENKNRTTEELKELILTYMSQNPSKELFHALNKKIEEINSSLERNLISNEVDFFTDLQLSLKERIGETQKVIRERILKYLSKDENCALALSFTYKKELEKPDAKDTNLIKGDTHLKAGKYKDALIAYEKALKQSPFLANVGRGDAFSCLGNWEAAILCFKTALMIKSKDCKARGKYVYALIERAKEFMRGGDFIAAALDLMEALNSDSDSFEASALLAGVYLSQNCINRAYVAAINALTVNANYVPALRVRGAIFVCWGKYQQAAQDLKKSLDIVKPDEHLFYNLALMHQVHLYLGMSLLDKVQATNLLDKAQADCNLLLGRDPTNSDGLMFQAKIALRQNRLKETERYINKYEKTLSNEIAFLSLKSEFLILSGDLDQALVFLNQAVKNYQDWVVKEKETSQEILSSRDKIDYYDILLQRAEVFHRMDFLEAAVSDFEQAIKLFPEVPKAYNLRGHFYTVHREWDKAKLDYENSKMLEAKEHEYISK